MNILLTGPFGNVGASVLPELMARGHTVTCFDLETPRNRKLARAMFSRYENRADVVWGDLTRLETILPALQGVDVVVHLAAVIPPLSDRNPALAKSVNVTGTRNLVTVMGAMSHPPRLLYTSTYDVYGDTHDKQPPRRIEDPINPQDHYARQKAEAEGIIRDSKLTWSILRLASVLPLKLPLEPNPLMFEVALETRLEIIHAADVATAIANALETEAAWGRTWLIGGGPRCQMYERDVVQHGLEAMGIGALPEMAFGKKIYYTDWLDTTESQRVLNYQNHSFEDYLRDMQRNAGWLRHVLRIIRPIVQAQMLQKSPYWPK